MLVTEGNSYVSHPLTRSQKFQPPVVMVGTGVCAGWQLVVRVERFGYGSLEQLERFIYSVQMEYLTQSVTGSNHSRHRGELNSCSCVVEVNVWTGVTNWLSSVTKTLQLHCWDVCRESNMVRTYCQKNTRRNVGKKKNMEWIRLSPFKQVCWENVRVESRVSVSWTRLHLLWWVGQLNHSGRDWYLQWQLCRRQACCEVTQIAAQAEVGSACQNGKLWQPGVPGDGWTHVEHKVQRQFQESHARDWIKEQK